MLFALALLIYGIGHMSGGGYLIYGDKVSLFAEELEGFMCADSQKGSEPVVDCSVPPHNFERLVFTFSRADNMQSKYGDYNKTGKYVNREEIFFC